MAATRRCALVTVAMLPLLGAHAAPLVPLVDTRIGSGGSAYGDGSVNPGVQVAFGALRLGPDTTWVDPTLGQLWFDFEHFGGYHYNDTHVRAFSHTHTVGAGVTDWGNFGVIVVRALSPPVIAHSTSVSGYMSAFSHANETAEPGYYAVALSTHAVYTEVTASGTHTGAHRYTCEPVPAGSNASCIMLLDVCHTASLPGACKAANVSVTPAAGPNGTNVVIMTGSVLNSGGLTGRGPLGGVWVHLYGEVRVTGGTPVDPTPQCGLWREDALLPPVSAGGPRNASLGVTDNLGAWVDFGGAASSSQLTLTLRVGLSFLDPSHARDNLYADQGTGSVHPLAVEEEGDSAAVDGPWASDFPGLVAAAQEEWEGWLGRTQVTPTGAADDAYPVQATFAAATYRSLLAPTTYSEWDGGYLGMDGGVHATLYANGSTAGVGNTSAAPLRRYFSDMSLWDTHRTQNPWLSFVAPDIAADVTRSLLSMAGQGGHLPRWPMANVYTGCMDGSHGIAVLADAYFKCTPGVAMGSPDGPGGSVLDAIFAVTRGAVEAQDNGNRYAALGYVPSEDSDTAASTTLEYAYDDGIAALLANATPGQGAWASTWGNRSKSYANVWSAAASTVCPRLANGSFACPLSKWLPYPINSGYTEGNGAQWQWSAPHDLAGLLSTAFSGNGTAFAVALHELMSAQLLWPFVVAGVSDVLPNFAYWAGNEPDLLAPWEFNAAGRTFAYLTQFWSRFLLRFYYIASPDGVPGNDDFGTMSAWAAWTALGLYPLAGTDAFLLGSPSILNATVSLPSSASGGGGHDVQLTILVHNATHPASGTANRFVSSASVNGVPLSDPTVRFAALMPGRDSACGQGAHGSTVSGLLEFTLTDVPMEWGTGRVLTPVETGPFALPDWPAGVPVARGEGDRVGNVGGLPTPAAFTRAHADAIHVKNFGGHLQDVRVKKDGGR